MRIADAQEELRTRYVGGFYGQLVSGVLWLVSASLAVWSSPRAAIATLVVGGFFILPLTEWLVRFNGERAALSPTNAFRYLGMQVAFVLPLSMPLLFAVGAWFTGATLLVFAGVGKATAERQWRARSARQGVAADAAPRRR